METNFALALTEAPVGKRFRIAYLRSQPETCQRLRELGFCENVVIRCLNKGNGNLICEVCNARVGLSTLVAGSIFLSSDEEG
jgi:ferrous iron transport protein A